MRPIAPFAVALLLAGCQGPGPGNWYRVEPLVVHTMKPEGSQGPAITWDELKKWENDALNAPEGKQARARNIYLDRLLTRSEMICSAHMSEVAATGGSVAFGGSWMAAIFSTLGSVTGGAARSYSAVSTMFNAGTAAFNANVYHGYLTPAILRKVEDSRKELAKEVAAIKAQSVEDAPATKATEMALRYHERCSFYVGLMQIVQDSGRQTSTDQRTALDNQIQALMKEEKRLTDARDAVATDAQEVFKKPIEEVKSELKELRAIRTAIYGTIGMTAKETAPQTDASPADGKQTKDKKGAPAAKTESESKAAAADGATAPESTSATAK